MTENKKELEGNPIVREDGAASLLKKKDEMGLVEDWKGPLACEPRIGSTLKSCTMTAKIRSSSR